MTGSNGWKNKTDQKNTNKEGPLTSRTLKASENLTAWKKQKKYLSGLLPPAIVLTDYLIKYWVC